VRSAEGQRADSLQLQALALNPFLYLKLDRHLLSALVRAIASERSGTSSPETLQIEWQIEQYLAGAPEMRAWYAYTSGRFPEALGHYARAISRSKAKAALRTQRGRLFFQLDQADSALAELTRALAEMRKGDQKELVHLYESKALLEHSIGLVHQRLGAADSARAAFGRALEEDLAFHPAHVQLGLMALQAQDTTTALGELDLAVQLRGEDAGLRLFYGYTLGSLSRYADAEVQLRKAVELNDVWAAPHHMLGEVLEAQRRNADALAEYRRFLALASRQDRAWRT
jgi:tetratricopeptide (TPR) repeat protein